MWPSIKQWVSDKHRALRWTVEDVAYDIEFRWAATKRFFYEYGAFFVATALLLLAFFVWAFIAIAIANSNEKPQPAITALNGACPGMHVSDFDSEIGKTALVSEKMGGDYLKHFFIEHAVAARASAKVLNLRPVSGLIVYPPKSPTPGSALLVYFDNKGCYLLSAKIDLGMLKALKATVQKKHV